MKTNPRVKTAVLILLPVVVVFVSLFLGRYVISPFVVLKVLAAKILPIQQAWPETINTVIFNIRLPRILTASMIGAGLSISGASFQGLFRNPLVSPDLLGVSSAAGFGASLAILLSGNTGIIQASAFIFGLAGVTIAYLISRVFRTTPLLMLVLSGVVVAAFFSALISATKFIADPVDKLPAITFWLMGSINSTTYEDLKIAIFPISFGITGLLLVRWRLNIMSFGDQEARALGIKTEALKAFIIICATMITAAAVCISGMIGWVGLVIPHIGRMIVGPNHKALLPASISLGAVYLLIIDDIARTLFTSEIPLGILTAVIGAPFFAYLLRKTKGGWH
jgi:iron complex transport system permease protein